MLIWTLFLFQYMELVPKDCPHLSVTLRIFYGTCSLQLLDFNRRKSLQVEHTSLEK
jgi:hypothetical protein